MTDQKKGQPKMSQTSVRAHERALEIFREAPVSELKDLVFHDHIEKHSKHSFESLVQQSGHIWDGLPDSVIGTLIYFILVEHNVEGFESLSTLYYIAMVGIPVYFTFLLQADIVYELYLFLGTTNVSNQYIESCFTSLNICIHHLENFYIHLYRHGKATVNLLLSCFL